MGLKKNFAYSFILTGANYIFPLIIYPYISRVLGVERIGVCNFVDSVINYFILFSMMGMNILGIREVARCAGDKIKLNETFSNLFALNILTSVIALVVYIVAILLVPDLREYRELLLIGVFKIIGNVFLIEWFFKGIENFKYITSRTIVVRSFYVISVFAFVKTQADITTYFFLTSLIIIINGALNWCYSLRFVTLKLKGINFSLYSKPFFSLGLYSLLTSLYTTFNVVYLGLVCGPVEVGYYTTATKLYGIIISVFSAITAVLMPRISSLVADENHVEIKNILMKSIKVLILFSLPAVILSIYFAPEIIYLISGAGYEGAITPMRIVMPLILVIGLAQILVVQILTPYKCDNQIIGNSILGALTGIICNFIFVSKFGAIGSSIVWLISEIVVTISAAFFVYKKCVLSFFIADHTQN